METKAAIAYCRVSDPRQVKRHRRIEPEREKDSLERQEAKAKAFAKQSGWAFLKCWLEEGESAKTEDRQKLWEMHAWCKKNRGKAQVLIIPMIDRFARNTEDYHDLKRRFRALNIRIVSVSERFEDTPEGRLQENVLASFAQFDNERRAERCKDGMVEAVRAGRWVWKAPYGFRNVKLADHDPNIAPYDPEAIMLRRAFEMLDARTASPHQIYQVLQEEGLRLSHTQFYAALRNPIYTGLIRAFNMEAQASGSFIPIVPNDLFWRVQSLLEKEGGHHRKSYTLDHPDFPLRGTVRCGCGKFVTASWTRRTHTAFGYYRCFDCQAENHRKDTIEGDFVTLLDNHHWPEDIFDTLTPRIKHWWAQRHVVTVTKQRHQEAEQHRLKELQKAVALKAAEGTVPDDIAREQIDDLRRQAALLTKAPEMVADPTVELPCVIDFGKQVLTQPGTFWKHAQYPTKKKLQTFLLHDGVVYTRSGKFANPQLRLLQPKSGVISTSNQGWWTKDENVAMLVRELILLYQSLQSC
jgi:site-specific DNA recombinase